MENILLRAMATAPKDGTSALFLSEDLSEIVHMFWYAKKGLWVETDGQVWSSNEVDPEMAGWFPCPEEVSLLMKSRFNPAYLEDWPDVEVAGA